MHIEILREANLECEFLLQLRAGSSDLLLMYRQRETLKKWPFSVPLLFRMVGLSNSIIWRC